MLGHVQPYYPLPRCPGTFTGPDHGLRPGPAPAVPGFAADAARSRRRAVMTPGVPGWWAVALRQRRQARSVRVSTVRQMIRSRHLDFPHKTKCEPSRRLSADPVNIVVSALAGPARR